MEQVDIKAVAKDYAQWQAFWGTTHVISQDEFNQLSVYQREDMVRHKLTVGNK